MDCWASYHYSCKCICYCELEIRNFLNRFFSSSLSLSRSFVSLPFSSFECFAEQQINYGTWNDIRCRFSLIISLHETNWEKEKSTAQNPCEIWCYVRLDSLHMHRHTVFKWLENEHHLSCFVLLLLSCSVLKST